MKTVIMCTVMTSLFCFAGQIQKTFSFSPSDINVNEALGYDYITLRSCSNMEESGRPSLPYRSLSFVIPASAVLTDIAVNANSEVWLVESYNIFPAQNPRPVSSSEPVELTLPDDLIYQSDNLYPGHLYREFPTGNMNGFKIAHLQIFPIQYMPSEKRTKLYTSVTVNLYFEEDHHNVVVKNARQVIAFTDAVKSLVENPEDVDRFAPSAKEGELTIECRKHQLEGIPIIGEMQISPVIPRQIDGNVGSDNSMPAIQQETPPQKQKRERIINTTSAHVVPKPRLEAPHPSVQFEDHGETTSNAYISSPHPYENNMNQSCYVYGPPENTWMCIHFAQIDVESGWDHVYVYDNDGTLLNTYSGSYGSVWSDWGDGPTFTVQIVTDGSVTDYGFDVDYIQVGTYTLYQNSHHPYLPNTDESIDMYGPENDWIGEVIFLYDSIVTESNYDYIYCYDMDNSTLLNTWSGSYDDVWSNWSSYNTSFTTRPHERSRLTSDGSIQYYGWLVDYYNFFRSHRIESAHNYSHNLNQTYYVYAPQDQGPLRMRVHFAKLNTEAGYDYLEIYDAENNLVNSYSGDMGTDFWSNWGQGNYMRIVLSSDYSISKWGFKIDEYEYEPLQPPLPNLTYYMPAGWDFPIVPSSVPGTNTVGPNLQGGATTYIDWAIKNVGEATAEPLFYTYLYSDGVPLQGWYTDSLPPNWYAYVLDYEHTFTAGDHTLMTFADSTNVVEESDETDNRYQKTFTWQNGGGIGWDHVMITNNTLKPHWNDFRSSLRSNYSIDDTVITTEYIYSNYTGSDNQEKIRNFISDAVNNHSTAYVLLGGDVEVVPYRKTYSGYSKDNDWHDTIPCDLYYADLDGDWDNNGNGTYGEPGDNIDMHPDVWLGRAVVNTATDIATFTDHFVDYHTTATHQAKVLLAGFDLDGVTFGETTMEEYSSDLPGGYVKKKIYDSHSGNHKDTLEEALNDGQNIGFHIDHGGVTWMGCGSGRWYFSNSDFDYLTNDPEYTVFTSIACLIGAFDSSDCCMEHFMDAANGGAVSCMTNSRYGWYPIGQNPQSSFSAMYMRCFFDRIFGHSPARNTDFLLGKADCIAEALSSNIYRWSMYALNLFGEPIQKIHIPYTVHVAEAEYSASLFGNKAFVSLCITPIPFRNSALIRITLPEKTDLTLDIFNAVGQKLCSKIIEYKSPTCALYIEELTETQLPCGVYFITVSTPTGECHTKKVVKIR